MHLTSSAFESKGRIPARYTCDGADVSPPLAWTDPPVGTRALHWSAPIRTRQAGCGTTGRSYDIPAATRALAEHWLPTRKSPPQAINGFRRSGYGGPCPPRGDAPHHCRFRPYALSAERLGPHTRCRVVEAAGQSHAIVMADLIGVYQRT